MIRVTIQKVDVTDYVENLTWSNVDPGGFEAAAFELSDAVEIPSISDEVIIWDGMRVLFLGYVEEPGDGFRGDGAPAQVNCVGAGALLKDRLMSMVFVDKDLSRWGQMSSARYLNLKTLGYNTIQDSEPFVDPSTAAGGAPGIRTVLAGPWTAIAMSEAWYDAGYGNTLGTLYYGWARGDTTQVNPADTNWTWGAYLVQDDSATTFDSSGNLRAAGPSTGSVSASTGNRRYALVQSVYAGTAGGNGVNYPIQWTDISVVGNHGIPVTGFPIAVGRTAWGIYTQDIVKYVLNQIVGGKAITVGNFSPTTDDFFCQQSAYYTPVTHEQIIDDMSKLSGFHWGVWEPFCPFTDESFMIPRLDYKAYPTVPTAIVDRADCQLSLTQRTSDVYTSVVVQYTDAAGSAASVTIGTTDYRLSSVVLGNTNSGRPRTLLVDIGTSDATNATTYGTDLLALAQSTAARGSGQGDLPPTVFKFGSTKKPSHFLRAGIDALQINNLQDNERITSTSGGAFNTFRISRVSCTASKGSVQTTVELDHGADLLEVLNARLAIATQLGGF